MDAQNARFEGWALIELFGHQREAGYVTTQYFGDRAMFQVDVPEIPARTETTDRPRWIGDVLAPAGAVVEGAAIPGRTRLINPGAVYAMNPATEDAVRAAIQRGAQREIKVISLPENAQLSTGETQPDRCEEEDEFPEGWNGDGR
jgi:hypothetical protein